jgi:hypothetical protein
VAIGVERLQVAFAKPDDVGVDRDLDGGMAGASYHELDVAQGAV